MSASPAPESPAPLGGSAAPIEESSIRGRKSVGLGVLYSLALPGAGHLYAGSKRGWINIGADILSWVAYLHYHDLGKSKEDEFENYADAHWDRDRWLQSGCTECYAGSPADSLLLAFRDRNPQQYYEDIGKLSTYFGGWDDYVPGADPQFSSSNRRLYKGMRDHSNNFLKNADYGLAAALVNRVVSAVDVFRMLKRRASPMVGEGTRLRFHLRTKPFATETRLGLEVTKRL